MRPPPRKNGHRPRSPRGAAETASRPLEDSLPPAIVALLESHRALSPLALVRALQLHLALRCGETVAHGRRISRLAGRLAAGLGSDAREQARIRRAATLHDIGKLALPDRILHKPGRLDAEERREMTLHAELGAAILRRAGAPQLELAVEVAHAHHERWDGRGYPRGLAGREIPLAARIVAVADVYDALRRSRVYRPRLPESAVRRMLVAGSGRQFDPEVLECFLELLDPAGGREATGGRRSG